MKNKIIAWLLVTLAGVGGPTGCSHPQYGRWASPLSKPAALPDVTMWPSVLTTSTESEVEELSSDRSKSTAARFDPQGQLASASRPADVPSEHLPQMALARLSERRGKIDQARKMYQALARREPENPLPWHRLAILAARQQQWEVAERYFRQAYTLAPPTSELLSDMSYSYYRQRQLDTAQELAQRAVEQDPQNKTAYNNLGLVLAQQERWEEALAAFRVATSEAEAQANLAYVLARKGERHQAMEQYSRALSHDAELRIAARALLQLAETDAPATAIPVPESNSHTPKDRVVQDDPLEREELEGEAEQAPEPLSPQALVEAQELLAMEKVEKKVAQESMQSEVSDRAPAPFLEFLATRTLSAEKTNLFDDYLFFDDEVGGQDVSSEDEQLDEPPVADTTTNGLSEPAQEAVMIEHAMASQRPASTASTTMPATPHAQADTIPSPVAWVDMPPPGPSRERPRGVRPEAFQARILDAERATEQALPESPIATQHRMAQRWRSYHQTQQAESQQETNSSKNKKTSINGKTEKILAKFVPVQDR